MLVCIETRDRAPPHTPHLPPERSGGSRIETGPRHQLEADPIGLFLLLSTVRQLQADGGYDVSELEHPISCAGNRRDSRQRELTPILPRDAFARMFAQGVCNLVTDDGGHGHSAHDLCRYDRCRWWRFRRTASAPVPAVGACHECRNAAGIPPCISGATAGRVQTGSGNKRLDDERYSQLSIVPKLERGRCRIGHLRRRNSGQQPSRGDGVRCLTPVQRCSPDFRRGRRVSRTSASDAPFGSMDPATRADRPVSAATAAWCQRETRQSDRREMQRCLRPRCR